MIRYYDIVKKFFSLKVTNKKLLIFLLVTALARSTSLLTLPYFAAKIVEYATIKDYYTTIVMVCILGVCFFVYNVCHHLNFVAYAKFAEYTHNALQKSIMKKVAIIDENYAKDMTSSFIVNTAFNDVGNVMQIPDFLFDGIAHLFSVIASLVILFGVNKYIGLVALVLEIMYLFYISINLKPKERYLAGQRAAQDKIVGLLGQVIDGSKEIKSFNMEEDLNSHFDVIKRNWSKNYFRKRKYNDRAQVIAPMFTGVAKLIIYVILIYMASKGIIATSIVILVIGYVDEIISKGKKLFDKINKISANEVRVNRIYQILNYSTENMIEFGKNANDDIIGNITFDNVSFTYEEKKILKNVSFDIDARSFVAIVGKSGSGKSTIFRILLRLYKIDSGHAYIDGTDIYDYTKKVYSSNVSIVTQRPFVFDMSIRENLNLVDSNKENQIAACKRVGIHDFIMSLPKGYNTKLLKDGSNISTGQKQLLAIARTLLSKSEILLFDEVTSSLDPNTSKQIIKILKDLKKDHTVLMITHKPKLMKAADKIIVIDNGKKVGEGTHNKLMQTNKYYQILQK